MVAGKSMAWHVVRYPASSFGGFYKNKILLELGLMTYLCSNKKERKEKKKGNRLFSDLFFRINNLSMFLSHVKKLFRL